MDGTDRIDEVLGYRGHLLLKERRYAELEAELLAKLTKLKKACRLFEVLTFLMILALVVRGQWGGRGPESSLYFNGFMYFLQVATPLLLLIAARLSTNRAYEGLLQLRRLKDEQGSTSVSPPSQG